MKVEIFSKDDCGYCTMAIQEATAKELDFEVKKLGVDFDREQLLEQFPTARTFPQIRIDGVAIGGFTEFKNYLNTIAD